MWDSGYVVVPTTGGCCLNISLQVDPKVSIAECCIAICKHVESGVCGCSGLCARAAVSTSSRPMGFLGCSLHQAQLTVPAVPAAAAAAAAHHTIHRTAVQGWIPTSVVNFSLEVRRVVFGSAIRRILQHSLDSQVKLQHCSAKSNKRVCQY
jgi:hypothetical protein